jgi:hypothetical protein
MLTLSRSAISLYRLPKALEAPVVFDHPAVSRSWVSYQVRRDEEEQDAVIISTILHLEVVQRDPAKGPEEWEELTDAVATYLLEHDDVERALR